MKILMLTDEFPPFPGGVATYAEELAIAAAGLGHEVTVAAPSYGGSRTDRSQYPFQVKEYAHRTGVAKYAALLARLVRLSRDRTFDIVHSVDLPYHLALRRTRRLFEPRLIQTVHGTDILLARYSWKGKILGGRRPFLNADGILANSRFTGDLFLRHNPDFPSDRLRVTPLGVDQYWFDRATADEARAVETKYGLIGRNRVILTVARLTPRKGHDTLFEALPHLPAAVRDDAVHICVGKAEDPRYEAELRRLADSAGMRVIFAGAVQKAELRALYQRANVFCLPGHPNPVRVEGFGLVYLEAAAQGLPSVACAVDAIPEVVLDGKTGWLVQPGDASALAEALVRPLENPDGARDMGREARRWAREFTWRRCARLSYGS